MYEYIGDPHRRGFYDYNSIKINEVRSQQIQEARESEQIPVTGTVEQNDSTDAKVEQIPAAQKEDYGVADFNAKYQPDASYDLKGVDSDISKLDVEKALSDLKKIRYCSSISSLLVTMRLHLQKS